MKYFLSHYTKLKGLEGIARSQTLWATNYLKLNDKTEYIYSWNPLIKAAFAYVSSLVPDDLREKIESFGLPDFIADSVLQPCLVPSYGQLYVTSFSLAENDDDERNGSLTMWDRYTQNEGYCLQFDVSEIQRIVDREGHWNSYLSISSSNITYGLDEKEENFLSIKVQIGIRMLEKIRLVTRDKRVDALLKQMSDPRLTWAPVRLLMNLMDYCGTHKEPSFRDEREFRILAYPHSELQTGVFRGASMPKKIYDGSDGKKYIKLCEYIRPGIRPRRIIVGPKADRNIEHLLDQFPERPQLAYSEIPIR